MTDEKITTINKIGKVSAIIARIVFVFAVIAAVATAGVGIAAACVPSDIAKVSINGTAEVEIAEKYLNIGKHILSEVNNGMTEEGQTIDIGGSEYEYVSANIDGDKININYKSLDNQLGTKNLVALMCGACLECINVAVLLVFVIALCKAIEKCASPFEESIIDKMKRLAIAFVPWLFVNGLASSISALSISTHFEYNLGFVFGTILIVLTFVVLISVFKYGAVLQQQSDETL